MKGRERKEEKVKTRNRESVNNIRRKDGGGTKSVNTMKEEERIEEEQNISYKNGGKIGTGNKRD